MKHISDKTLEKMTFYPFGNYFYQHKPKDGKLIKIEVMGHGREPIVIRSLFRPNDKISVNNLDIRYFTLVENHGGWFYIQTRDGIQLKDYGNNNSWLGGTMGKVWSILEEIIDRKKYPKEFIKPLTYKKVDDFLSKKIEW